MPLSILSSVNTSCLARKVYVNSGEVSVGSLSFGTTLTAVSNANYNNYDMSIGGSHIVYCPNSNGIV